MNNSNNINQRTLEERLLMDAKFILSHLSKKEENRWYNASKSTNPQTKAEAYRIMAEALTRGQANASSPADKAAYQVAIDRQMKLFDKEIAKTPAPAEAENEEGNILIRDGKLMPWFGQDMGKTGRTIIFLAFAVYLIAFALEVTGIPVARPVFTALGIGFLAFNGAQIVAWYRRWSINSNFGKGKTYGSFLLTGLFIWGAINSNNVHQEFCYWLLAAIALIFFFSFSHWLLKLELLAAIVTLGLLLVWSEENIHIEHYELVINDQNMVFSLSNLLLKLEAFLMAFVANVLKVVLIFKLHWLALIYIIFQGWAFRIYVRGRHFTQELG